MNKKVAPALPVEAEVTNMYSFRPLSEQTTDQKNQLRRMSYYQGMLDITFSRLVQIITG